MRVWTSLFCSLPPVHKPHPYPRCYLSWGQFPCPQPDHHFACTCLHGCWKVMTMVAASKAMNTCPLANPPTAINLFPFLFSVIGKPAHCLATQLPAPAQMGKQTAGLGGICWTRREKASKEARRVEADTKSQLLCSPASTSAPFQSGIYSAQVADRLSGPACIPPLLPPTPKAH